ncbi:MAG: hypothetical protein M1832_002720 [Thelocarpon impressellum]|nr:MAG: hypothetical protein M1832_002720 [Thelocarpon impressellum]
MARTDTTVNTSFTRTGQVTYRFEPPYGIVTIELPSGSSWSSGLHWHETHTEFLEVVEGTATVTLDGVTRDYTPRDGVIRVEPFCVHEWRRAEEADGELVVSEWTAPLDGQKEIFFRNLNSVLLENRQSRLISPALWIPLQLFVMFHHLDNYPVFAGGMFRRWISHAVLTVAWLLGMFLGMEAIYEEYTPPRLLSPYRIGEKTE